MSEISSLLVKTDLVCDYFVPLTPITNLVDIFLKCVVLPCMDEATIGSNHYYKHINEKSFARCFLLIIPVIGSIIIGIYDCDDTSTGQTQSDSLDDINNMTTESLDNLCKNIVVNNRNDFIRCMLIFAIKAEKFNNGDADVAFHDAISRFQDDNRNLKPFVHEDIAAGRNNEDTTLLHEILKCEFLSPKTKGSAFGFILRDGHDYLRDYYGNRSLGPENAWGNRPVNFEMVRWGDSLKNIFDTFTIEQQKEFFANSSGIAQRLKAFTGIEQKK